MMIFAHMPCFVGLHDHHFHRRVALLRTWQGFDCMLTSKQMRQPPGCNQALLTFHHRVTVAVLAHMYTPRLWPGYRSLAPRQKLAWTNRVASAAHVGPRRCCHVAHLPLP